MSVILSALLAAIQPEPVRLNLPVRRAEALGWKALARNFSDLGPKQREESLVAEVLAGNVPEELRVLKPVTISGAAGQPPLTIFVACDYLAVGSASDRLYIPLTPYGAEKICAKLDCLLPTPKVVDEIYRAADLKLEPRPIPPSPQMVTLPDFEQHSSDVVGQRSGSDWGKLVAGTQKDVVICKGIESAPTKVAIYGWQRLDGSPIQPLFLGHNATWADYSHGIRLISRHGLLGGKNVDLDKILRDPDLCKYVSNEGSLSQTHYKLSEFPRDGSEKMTLPPDEKLDSFEPARGVRVVVHSPRALRPKVKLVLYALPNGNTIEQTMGRRMHPGIDWHFDIQHIAAQTRFLRSRFPDSSIVVAYIENVSHAWPGFLRQEKDPRLTEAIVEAIKSRFVGHELSMTLNSHSGGGAFVFDYIANNSIDPAIDRIAFLDSEYAYDPNLHLAKLTEWLRTSGHSLCCLAYDDANALYQGKPVVSASGGTWGRTHLMMSDLEKSFGFDPSTSGDPARYTALKGRITIWLKSNPDHEIFHTVQVEKNGFIESMLSGTDSVGEGYKYFGKRAYSEMIND